MIKFAHVRGTWHSPPHARGDMIRIRKKGPVMSKDYQKPKLVPVSFDFENAAPLAHTQPYMTLSRMDVLGIVQSAYDELGASDSGLIAAKRDVLGEVADGQLALALRTAIVGAGKAGCGCSH